MAHGDAHGVDSMVPRGRDDVAQDVPEERLRIFVRHLLAILAGEREADAEGLSWLLLQECLEPMSVAEELLHSYFATKRAQLVDIVSQMHPGCSTGLARRMRKADFIVGIRLPEQTCVLQ